MSITEQTAPDLKVADLGWAEFGRKEISLASPRDARPDGDQRGVRRQPAAEGCSNHGIAAYGRSGRRADRDTGGTRHRVSSGVLQHLDAGPCCGRSRHRPDGTPTDPKGVPVFAWKGETLTEHSRWTEQALTRSGSMCCPSIRTRRSHVCTSTRWTGADRAMAGPGRVRRRPARRSEQTRPLPLRGRR
jgi:hypothetical protein